MSEPVLSGGARPVQDERALPIIVYVLYLFGGTSLIGFILAYVLKGRSIEPARSHYVFQIRTMWIGLVICAVGAMLILFGLPLTLILVGFVFLKLGWGLFGVAAVWIVVRSLVGLIYIARGQPYPRPDAWLI